MRLDNYTKTQLQERASEFFLRLQHTNPFPATEIGVVPKIDDMIYNTYISCLPQHVRNAILTLMVDDRYIDVLDTNTSAALILKVQHPVDPDRIAKVPITFNFSTQLPSCPSPQRGPDIMMKSRRSISGTASNSGDHTRSQRSSGP